MENAELFSSPFKGRLPLFEPNFLLSFAKASKIIDSVSISNRTAAVLATYEQALDRNKNRYTYDYCIAMARCVRILRYGALSVNKITQKNVDKEINLWTPNCWS